MENNKPKVLEMDIRVQLEKEMVEQHIETKLSDEEWNVFIENGEDFEIYLHNQTQDLPFQEYILGECIESFLDDFLQDKEW